MKLIEELIDEEIGKYSKEIQHLIQMMNEKIDYRKYRDADLGYMIEMEIHKERGAIEFSDRLKKRIHTFMGANVMKDNYQFPAVFKSDDDGISIFFPDLPGCLPCADNMTEAFRNAKEALQLHLYGMEKDGESIPTPSDPADLPLEKGQYLTMIDVQVPLPEKDK